METDSWGSIKCYPSLFLQYLSSSKTGAETSLNHEGDLAERKSLTILVRDSFTGKHLLVRSFATQGFNDTIKDCKGKWEKTLLRFVIMHNLLIRLLMLSSHLAINVISHKMLFSSKYNLLHFCYLISRFYFIFYFLANFSLDFIVIEYNMC